MSSCGLLTREALEAHEREWLAPYAMYAGETAGRLHPEPEDHTRSVYRRDRDRIIHSTAFRRLEYKTQVFVNHEGDYYRTRLTHTLEVAQIAGSIARAMRLNEDLAETVALAHDIGHPPFGHAGEEALRELMRDHGGFDHNIQGLRVVDQLEARYPSFPGLNLTREVREGINKHRTPFDRPAAGHAAIDPGQSQLLEAQLTDVADEIAYDNHDLDDGLTSGLLREEQLNTLRLWREASEAVEARHGRLAPEIHKYQIIRALINRQVTDLVAASLATIERHEIRTVQDVRRCQTRLITFSQEMVDLRKPMKDLLWHELYKHYRVVRMAGKARRFLEDLFQVYLSQPDQLPPGTRARVDEEGLHRAICDYVAGMTDRYALNEHKKLFDPYERV